MNKSNYRQYYITMLELDLPKEIEIHHINGDRKDNNLKNLVALPRKLHKKYHRSLDNFKTVFKCGIPLQLKVLNSWEYHVLNEYISAYKECECWLEKRDWRIFELGLLDNPYGHGEIKSEGR